MAVHDPETCPTCGPIMATDAYKRGAARARGEQITPVIPPAPANPAAVLLEATR